MNQIAGEHVFHERSERERGDNLRKTPKLSLKAGSPRFLSLGSYEPRSGANGRGWAEKFCFQTLNEQISRAVQAYPFIAREPLVIAVC